MTYVPRSDEVLRAHAREIVEKGSTFSGGAITREEAIRIEQFRAEIAAEADDDDE